MHLLGGRGEGEVEGEASISHTLASDDGLLVVNLFHSVLTPTYKPDLRLLCSW